MFAVILLGLVVIDFIYPQTQASSHHAFLGGLLGGIVSGIGSLFGANQTNNANAQMSREAAQFNAAEADKQRHWQTEQANSAYQRAMYDMEHAGLNPMLAYSQGGAATPGGATATMSPAKMEDGLSKGIASAVDTRRLQKELAATDSTIKLNEAAMEAKQADTVLSQNSAKVAEKNAQKIDAEMPAIKAQSKLDAKRAKIDNSMAEFDAINNRAKSTLGTANSAIDLFKPKFRGGTDTIINQKGEVIYEGPKDPYFKRRR